MDGYGGGGDAQGVRGCEDGGRVCGGYVGGFLGGGGGWGE